MSPLPIDGVLPGLLAALERDTGVVLVAPPGAGKTTRVPLALLDAPWLAGKRIVMLEPRRLAARAAATYMARLLGEEVGGRVGYRMRNDTRVSARTRIEVVTEGVLTRRLQNDPALDDAGIVILDEYHERSLQADLGLALTLETQAVLRPELRVLVMSATLDGAAVATLLAREGMRAPVVASEGRSFPVEVRWATRRPADRPGGRGGRELESAVATTVREALREHDGDILVFLPGAAEIGRVAGLLSGEHGRGGVRVLPLYGAMPQGAQDEAVGPSGPGTRKVVLATSIAETSLTIEGVRVVVDGGLARVPRFSPASGMTSLDTVRVSRAGAEQRCGRAGRVAPGVCYRLWPEHEHHHLLAYAAPEIREADLAPLALELAAAGIAHPSQLRWLDEPPAGAFAQARELLAQLGALDGTDEPGRDARITPHGRRMSELPLHPRLAHMVLRATGLGATEGTVACTLAALLSERDVLRRAGERPDPDLRHRLALVLRDAGHAAANADVETLRRVRNEARELAKRVNVRRADPGIPVAAAEALCGGILAFAYPDRIAQRRTDGPPGRYLLRNGRGALLDESQSLAREPYLVAAELDDREREARIQLAAPVSLDELMVHHATQVTREEEVTWDSQAGRVQARTRDRLGALVLREGSLRDPDPERLMDAVLAGVLSEGIDRLPWSDGARRLRERLAFVHALGGAAKGDEEWPDVGDASLAARAHEWLRPHLAGVRRREELARLDLHDALLGMLGWRQRSLLDELAPTHITVPSGSRIPIDYSDPAAPVLAVRLQEMFGSVEGPAVARGRVPLTLHLLSPAHRPVQVTRDLAGFWRSSYFDVRKDLRGRYPKHHWPENPLEAAPTRKAKGR